MITPSEKELLKSMKVTFIQRYGSLTAGARELGLSRWTLRRAALGKAPRALRKMQDAGIIFTENSRRIDIAANSAAALKQLRIQTRPRLSKRLPSLALLVASHAPTLQT
jgi:hypothetical protein